MKPSSFRQSALIPFREEVLATPFNPSSLLTISQITCLLFLAKKFRITLSASWEEDGESVSGSGDYTTESAGDFYNNELEMLPTPNVYVGDLFGNHGSLAPAYYYGTTWAVANGASLDFINYDAQGIHIVPEDGVLPTNDADWFNLTRPTSRVRAFIQAFAVTSNEGRQYVASTYSEGLGDQVGICRLKAHGVDLPIPIYGLTGDTATMTVEAVEYWSYGGTVNTSTGAPIIS